MAEVGPSSIALAGRAPRLSLGSGGSAVNRRAFEVTVITVVLMQPVLGLVRLWTRKTFMATTPDSVSHKTADVVTIFTG